MAVGVLTRLLAGDKGILVQFPVHERDYFLSEVPRPALGSTKLLLNRVPGVISQEVRRPGRKPGHSFPSITEVKNEWSYKSTDS